MLTDDYVMSRVADPAETVLASGDFALSDDVTLEAAVLEEASVFSEPVLARSNGNLGGHLGVPAKDQFSGETGAETVLGWERHTGDSLEDRALTSRLVSTDDNLG